MWPVTLVIFVSVISFTVWQIKSGYGWVRKEVDEVTGESVGLCLGDDGVNSDVYLLPNYAMQFVTILAASIMAWKTLGFDDDYSESKWVLALILVQIQVSIEKMLVFSLELSLVYRSTISFIGDKQVLIVGGPVIALLHDVDPTARYLGLALLTFSFPISAMGLLIFPKAVIVRKMSRKEGNTPLGSPLSPGESPPEVQAGGERNDGEARDDSTRRSQEPARNGPRIQIVTFD